MINFRTINIVGQPNFILRGYDKILKNMQTASEDWLRIGWKCMKIALIF